MSPPEPVTIAIVMALSQSIPSAEYAILPGAGRQDRRIGTLGLSSLSTLRLGNAAAADLPCACRAILGGAHVLPGLRSEGRIDSMNYQQTIRISFRRRRSVRSRCRLAGDRDSIYALLDGRSGCWIRRRVVGVHQRHPGEERWAVDQVAYAEGTYAPGVHAVVSDVFEAEFPTEHFDAVWVSNFLEHLTTQESVALFLETMYAATVPGGRIAVMGPNFRYCSREYFDMADHTLIFTHRAIAEHLYAAGFVPERSSPASCPTRSPAGCRRRPRLTRLYLRSPLAWRALGKQFLVIGRRS